VRGEGVVWCDGGGRHWWVLTWCPKINENHNHIAHIANESCNDITQVSNENHNHIAQSSQ